MSKTEVGPHPFRALRPWDWLRSSGRCRACYLPHIAHPVRYWARARPLGDSRPAGPIDYDTLTGRYP